MPEAPPPNRPVPLPTFLIIGAQKSGTRWLRHNLGRHEQICTAPRELAFFNTDAYGRLGLEGYSRLFENWRGEPIVGEATPGYMMWREDPGAIAERIDSALPGVRLIALLRNPVDRIRSAVLHHSQRERIPTDRSPLSYLRSTPVEKDPWGIVVGSWYAASLRPYLERFGDRLQVLLHDDVVGDPEKTYRAACAHVGASDGFVPPALERVRFSNLDAAAQPSEAMRDGLTAGERAVLMGYVRDEIDALEELLGIDLSRWRLGAELTDELRGQALRLMIDAGAAPEAVADEVGVPAALLQRWRDQAVADLIGAYR